MQTSGHEAESEPKSVAERVAKHRRRKKQAELQIVYGIAKLVLGKELGDQRLAVLSMLEKASRDSSLPSDILDSLDLAVDRLKARGRIRF